jgi:hypothetical protein
MVVVAVVVRFVIVGFQQSGRTGLVHRHSTTRLAVIPATVGPARPTTPADIGRNRSHPLQRAHAAREQVPKGRPGHPRQRSPHPLAIAHSAIVLSNRSSAWPVGRIHSGRHPTCTIKTSANRGEEGGVPRGRPDSPVPSLKQILCVARRPDSFRPPPDVHHQDACQSSPGGWGFHGGGLTPPCLYS